jgi:hypothetical protein
MRLAASLILTFVASERGCDARSISTSPSSNQIPPQRGQ